MKVYKDYSVKLPSYSLSYLFYGDSSGITPEDILIIETGMHQFYEESKQVSGSIIITLDETDNTGDYESYFSPTPLFGLPCDVYDAHIIILVSED